MQTPTLARVLLSIGAIQALIIVVNLGRSKILSWLLGPEGFGVTSTIDQIVVTVVQLGGLSLQFTALKFMATAHSQGQQQFQQAYDSFLRVLASLSLLATVVALGLLQQNPGLFGADLAPHQAYIRIAIVGVPAAMLNIFFMHTLAAAQQPFSGAMLNLCYGLMAASGAVVGVLLYGILGLYIASAITTICVTAGCLYYMRRVLGLRSAVRGAPILSQIRDNPDLAPHSVQLYLALATYSLTMLVIRYFVLSRLGEAEAGWLQASLGIALSLGAVMGPMNNLYLTPLVNRQIPAVSKVAAANDFARKAIMIVLLASLPIVLFPEFFTTLLYTSRFRPVAATLFAFVAWQCLAQIVSVYGQVLIGLQDVLYFSVTTCFGYALTAMLALVFVPGIGLGGAALALSASAIFMGITAAFRLRSKHAAGIPMNVLLLGGYCLVGVLLPAWIPVGIGEGSAGGLAVRAAYALAVLTGLWFLVGNDDRAFVTRAAGGLFRARLLSR